MDNNATFEEDKKVMERGYGFSLSSAPNFDRMVTVCYRPKSQADLIEVVTKVREVVPINTLYDEEKGSIGISKVAEVAFSLERGLFICSESGDNSNFTGIANYIDVTVDDNLIETDSKDLYYGFIRACMSLGPELPPPNRPKATRPLELF